MNKTLAGLLLALGACTSTVKSPEQLREQEIKMTAREVFDTKEYLDSAKSDYKISRGEINQLIRNYDRLSRAVIQGELSDSDKKIVDEVRGQYKETVNDIFNHLDIYMIGTGVDTAEFSNVPANIGASKPLYVGKGAKVAKHIDFATKEAIVRKARDAWASYAVSKGTVQEGGARLIGLDDTSVIIGKDIAEKLVGEGIAAPGEGYKAMGKDLWARANDGNTANGELSRYRLTAVKPDSYDLPKPADKK
jgi:hypothetical protein